LEFIPKSQVGKILQKSLFMKQLKAKSGNLNPVHFLISLVGFIAFPFVARPMMLQAGLVNEKEFRKMMEERKKLVPGWLRAMLRETPKRDRSFRSRATMKLKTKPWKI
jgi:hypothetical protein